MRQNDFHSAAPVWAALSLLVLWLAAIAAYAYEDGMNLFQWMGRFSQVLERPFAIGWTPYTLKYMLGSLLMKPLPLSKFPRLQIMRLWDTAFTP